MMQNPAAKYYAFRPVNLVDRNWPNRTITQPPIWMSTDLRDGNREVHGCTASASRFCASRWRP